DFQHDKLISRDIGWSFWVSETAISTSLESARRLTATKQHLAGKLPTGPAREAILSVIRDLGFVQWDPVNVVAPSHLITLWSRVGKFRMADLDRLLWDDKKLFEHWSHAGFDRPHGRLSALLFVDEKVSGIPLQVMGRMEGESQKVAGGKQGIAEEIT